MKAVFAVVLLLGSVTAAMAADGYSDYRNYFNEKPAVGDRTKLKPARATSHSMEAVDTRRYEDVVADGKLDNLKAGYRNRAGIYVPPDYSTHPRGPTGDGFGSASSDSYGSVSAPNPFAGPLGTRR